MAERSVLITGVTGFVGREILYELLIGTDADLICLVRADDDESAQQRLRDVVDGLCGKRAWPVVAPRVTPLCGDINRPRLGLDPATYREVVARLTHVVHGAATVRFDLPLQAARRINVDGTREVLRLALASSREGRLERFGYVSTAFVAGRHDGLFGENDLDVGQSFHNTYERSKLEAELLVRSHDDRLPVTVVRPSIVLGHSQSGTTSSWTTLYWPLRVFRDGFWRYVPTSPDHRVDIVPVDFVARGTVEACLGSGRPAATYALAAGQGAPRAAEIADLAARAFDAPRPWLVATPFDRLVLPAAARIMSIGPAGRFGRALRQYAPYFLQLPRFDTTAADVLLQPRGIVAPPAKQFLPRVLRFAAATDFGRDAVSSARRNALAATRRRRALVEASGR